MASKLEQLMRDIQVPEVAIKGSIQATYGDKINVENARNDDERDLLADTKALFDQIDQAGGVEPASLINMHPWPIVSGGPHLMGIVVPACPIGQPFLQFVHKDIRVDKADKGGRYAITAIWPIMLMRDVVRQHEEWGGLVAYMGEARPGASKGNMSRPDAILAALLEGEKDEERRELLKQLRAQTKNDTRYATSEEVKNMMQSAEERQITYYRKRCSFLANAHASDAKMAFRGTTPNDRLMARWLHARGIFATLPNWVVEERPDNYKSLTCPKCGKDVETAKVDGVVKPKGFACTHCNYILDGIRALEAGEIDEGHVSLKRHSREELNAAGLKHVLTLAEERGKAEKQPKTKAGKEPETK